MAFDVKRDNTGQTNQHALLEVKLPDTEAVQKYSVKRLSKNRVSSLQIRGKKDGLSNNELGLDIVGEVIAGLEALDGSMDFADLADKVAEFGSESAVSDLTDYMMKLATESAAKLKIDGIDVW